MRSIRRRLVTLLAAGFVLLLLGAGAWLAHVVRERLTADFDTALEAKARSLMALTDHEGGHVELDYQAEAFPEFERERAPEYFQFWLHDGRSLLRSRRAAQDLPRRAQADEGLRLHDAPLPDGRAGRYVQLTFVPGRGTDTGDADEDAGSAAESAPAPPLVLVVAREREGLDRLLAGLTWSIVGVGAAAVVLALLLAWRAVAAGLAPLEQVASQVRALDADRLDARVRLPDTPREVAPIVHQLNALLGRLQQGFERERRFTGNVAHELRTPIAELRTIAEVGARWPEDAESVAAYFRDVAGVAGGMERIVDDLLLLARCQAGIEPVQATEVSLEEALRRAWRPHAARARERGLALDLALQGDVRLRTDAGKLGILLRNLLGNAVAHGLRHGYVAVRLARDAGRFCLEVRNPAELLEAEALQRLGEPFWRRDPARESSEHAGLGLSVVTEVAALLGLVVRLGQEPDGTFWARVEGSGQAARAGAGQPVPAG